jgi:hypothetical protein
MTLEPADWEALRFARNLVRIHDELNQTAFADDGGAVRDELHYELASLSTYETRMARARLDALLGED